MFETAVVVRPVGVAGHAGAVTVAGLDGAEYASRRSVAVYAMTRMVYSVPGS